MGRCHSRGKPIPSINQPRCLGLSETIRRPVWSRNRDTNHPCAMQRREIRCGTTYAGFELLSGVRFVPQLWAAGFPARSGGRRGWSSSRAAHTNRCHHWAANRHTSPRWWRPSQRLAAAGMARAYQTVYPTGTPSHPREWRTQSFLVHGSSGQEFPPRRRGSTMLKCHCMPNHQGDPPRASVRRIAAGGVAVESRRPAPDQGWGGGG